MCFKSLIRFITNEKNKKQFHEPQFQVGFYYNYIVLLLLNVFIKFELISYSSIKVKKYLLIKKN